MADQTFVLLVVIVVAGLVFDFINGFHDTANAIATSVATRVLSPAQAVAMAGILNFVGALAGTAVATTVGKGIIPPEHASQHLVLAALAAAIIWDLVTWWYGIPSSSSHALVFSIVGAGIAARRLAHHQDHGSEGRSASPDPRLRGRNCRGDGHRGGQSAGHPDFHHAHDQLGDSRRRGDAAPLGGALGRRGQHHHGVGTDHSG